MIVSAISSSPTRRGFLATSVAAGAFNLLYAPRTAAADNAIRPFRIDVPEEALVDLRRRVVATR
jgi:hypothetical protein